MKCDNCGRDNMYIYEYFGITKKVCGVCGYFTEDEDKK
jgi:hypothetical protein